MPIPAVEVRRAAPGRNGAGVQAWASALAVRMSSRGCAWDAAGSADELHARRRGCRRCGERISHRGGGGGSSLGAAWQLPEAEMKGLCLMEVRGRTGRGDTIHSSSYRVLAQAWLAGNGHFARSP